MERALWQRDETLFAIEEAINRLPQKRSTKTFQASQMAMLHTPQAPTAPLLSADGPLSLKTLLLPQSFKDTSNPPIQKVRRCSNWMSMPHFRHSMPVIGHSMPVRMPLSWHCEKTKLLDIIPLFRHSMPQMTSHKNPGFSLASVFLHPPLRNSVTATFSSIQQNKSRFKTIKMSQSQNEEYHIIYNHIINDMIPRQQLIECEF